MIKTSFWVAILGAILVFTTAPTFAHDEAQHANVWCESFEESSLPAGVIPREGNWPGPSQHKDMYRDNLGRFDLTTSFPALESHYFRARAWLMLPGGVIRQHCHADRPAIVFLLSGQVKETFLNNGIPQLRTLTAPVSIAEGNETTHWWVNRGSESVFMIAIDIPTSRDLEKGVQSVPPIEAVLNESATQISDKGVIFEDGDFLRLQNEYPGVSEVEGWMIAQRVVIVEPGGTYGVREYARQPAMFYVLEGQFLEDRSDESIGTRIVRKGGDIVFMNGSQDVETLWSTWENVTSEPASLLLIEFVYCGDQC